jgi:hypothetical protein
MRSSAQLTPPRNPITEHQRRDSRQALKVRLKLPPFRRAVKRGIPLERAHARGEQAKADGAPAVASARAMAAQELSIALELDYMRRHYPGLLSQENVAEG